MKGGKWEEERREGRRGEGKEKGWKREEGKWRKWEGRERPPIFRPSLRRWFSLKLR